MQAESRLVYTEDRILPTYTAQFINGSKVTPEGTQFAVNGGGGDFDYKCFGL